MKTNFFRRKRLKVTKLLVASGLSLAAAVARVEPARAQMPLTQPAEFWQHSVSVPEVSSALSYGADPDYRYTPGTPRIPMFRMLPGFLTDPPELSILDDPNLDPQPSASPPDGIVVSFGDDNPFLDPRRPGDPGGVGFLRVHSQVQVVDETSTSVCLGLRAWTPAGLEAGGVQNGQTIFAPGIGVFQELGAGSALHGFVDQSLRDCYHQGPVRYGMAVDCPITGWDELSDKNMFFFVQAIGRYEYGPDRQGRAANCELVPGVHWRLSDSFWLSVGASRGSMLTCWWHF